MRKLTLFIVFGVLLVGFIGVVSAGEDSASLECSNNTVGKTYCSDNKTLMTCQGISPVPNPNNVITYIWQSSICSYKCQDGNCVSNITTTPVCIGEGKKGYSLPQSPNDEADVCCEGLTKISNSFGDGEHCAAPTDGSFICSKCGNGQCGLGENNCNCPFDCGTPTTPVCDYANIDNLDVDKNGKVDENDKQKVSDNFGKENCSSINNWCDRTDVNRDGVVNTLDKALMLKYLGCKTSYVKDTDAYLNQKFELKAGQAAIVRDYKNMVIKYIRELTLMPACPIESSCPPSKTKIMLQVGMPSGDTTTVTEFNIGIGEKKQVFDVTISLIDLNRGVAVLLATKEDCPKGCICTENTVSCPACQEGYSWNPKTQKCESLVYECPEGCICTENTVSCPGKSAKVEGFRYAYWQCYDGAESKSTGREACKSAEFWKKFAENFCESHCKKYENGKCQEDSDCREVSCEICKPMLECQEGCLKAECNRGKCELCNKEGCEEGELFEKCGVNSFSISGECYYETGEVGEEEREGEGGEEPIEIEEGLVEEFLICKNSCPLDGKCYPFGYRKLGEYCSDEGDFVKQKKGEACENNFECSSNVCVNSNCISEGFLQKIMNWFKRLFGG